MPKAAIHKFNNQEVPEMDAKVKKYGKMAVATLAIMLVFNTLANRVPILAQVKNTVDNGL